MRIDLAAFGGLPRPAPRCLGLVDNIHARAITRPYIT
jgi:hypothetical protein